MHRLAATVLRTAAAAALCVMASAAHAQTRMVTVTVTNLAAANSISFAGTHVGFHMGAVDAFDIGTSAGLGIVSVAEGGVGTRWQADFAAADPTATRGLIAGALTPGQSRSQSFIVNAGLNKFFTFATMVIPSNDFLLGNDHPTGFCIFGSGLMMLVIAVRFKRAHA